MTDADAGRRVGVLEILRRRPEHRAGMDDVVVAEDRPSEQHRVRHDPRPGAHLDRAVDHHERADLGARIDRRPGVDDGGGMDRHVRRRRRRPRDRPSAPDRRRCDTDRSSSRRSSNRQRSEQNGRNLSSLARLRHDRWDNGPSCTRESLLRRLRARHRTLTIRRSTTHCDHGRQPTDTLATLQDLLAAAARIANDLSQETLLPRLLDVFARMPAEDRETIVQILEREVDLRNLAKMRRPRRSEARTRRG
jgi:hypothetical protein